MLHRLSPIILFSTLFFVANALGAEPVEVLLAREGRALMPVVIDAEASKDVRAVAEELAQYLGRVTGGEFSVRAGDGTSGIVLGTAASFPESITPAIGKALEIRDGFDGKEAFVIQSQPRRLLLLGATDLGASHAAFRFLEELGCRWFFPADEWEVVPSRPTLRVRLDIADRPAVLARRIWYGFGFFDRAEGRSLADYRAWARHNRMAQSLRVSCGHAWQGIIMANEKLFEEHPEYLALITVTDDSLPPPERIGDDRAIAERKVEDPLGLPDRQKPEGPRKVRRGHKLCVSNPEVVELCRRWALDYFKKHPERDMVSMEPSDGLGYCECAECAKIGTTSDQVFYLANEVARAVRKEYPDKWVGLLAYSDHSEPPNFELEPNVYVQLTAGFIRGRYSLQELLELWPRKCRNMGYYLYFSVYLWDWDMLPGGYAADVPRLRKDIPARIRNGASSIDCESGNNWGLHGRGYYVANRLMWDPDRDVDALLADFYEKAFGPAAVPMKRYYERFEPSRKPLMSDHLVGLGFRDVQEAARLAADRPDVLARLDHIKIYLRYFHLRWMLQRAKTHEEKKRLTIEALKHVYRTRYTYMNHWEAMRQYWVPRATKQFKGAGWNVELGDPLKAALEPDELGADPLGLPTRESDKPDPDAVPWEVEEPYTREQIEQFFQDGLDYFQTQDVAEKDFSRDLVPVKFEGAPRAATRHMYQGGVPYALYSLAGEPIRITVTTGILKIYRNRPAAKCKVTDAAGRVVMERTLPLDAQARELVIDVPAAGLYFFDIHDSSAAWRLQADKTQVLTVIVRRDRRMRHCGWMGDAYFYVPKGTREIQYYWKGGRHRVHGPDGELVKTVTTTGAFITVPVPEGADGRPWHFSQIAPGHLWFFNVPNYLAASPHLLLVPREVARADGLSIRKPVAQAEE